MRNFTMGTLTLAMMAFTRSAFALPASRTFTARGVAHAPTSEITQTLRAAWLLTKRDPHPLSSVFKKLSKKGSKAFRSGDEGASNDQAEGGKSVDGRESMRSPSSSRSTPADELRQSFSIMGSPPYTFDADGSWNAGSSAHGGEIMSWISSEGHRGPFQHGLHAQPNEDSRLRTHELLVEVPRGIDPLGNPHFRQHPAFQRTSSHVSSLGEISSASGYVSSHEENVEHESRRDEERSGRIQRAKPAKQTNSANGKAPSGASPLGSVRSEPVGSYERPLDVSPLLLSPSASSAYGTAEHRAAFYANRARSREASRGSSPADSLPSIHRSFEQSRSPDPATVRSASRASARHTARLKVLAEGNADPRYGVNAGLGEAGLYKSTFPESCPRSGKMRQSRLDPDPLPSRPSQRDPATSVQHYGASSPKMPKGGLSSMASFQAGAQSCEEKKLRAAAAAAVTARRKIPRRTVKRSRSCNAHLSFTAVRAHPPVTRRKAALHAILQPIDLLAVPSSATPTPSAATPERGRSRLVKSKKTRQHKKAPETTTTTLATTSRTGLAAHARRIERWIQYHPPDDARARRQARVPLTALVVASDVSPKKHQSLAERQSVELTKE
ncbi:hypothetical protein IE81DRAFT_369049 [Ceraceosorus guamensis]|uniref:Uncharacterized protein n=1 Tax=Ceraceosorus guamensis TaxID=1522189 RepID=A0A316VVK2_9BASI|nr:hypothetical protein IE81DRAFT_369049 [Ceraceosorus guamensis]PWN39475.1 hypothetical protein IE81DRAFT_369049 [Ceraceosorus guamensis]